MVDYLEITIDEWKELCLRSSHCHKGETVKFTERPGDCILANVHYWNVHYNGPGTIFIGTYSLRKIDPHRMNSFTEGKCWLHP